jgi:hypothetical protein
VLQNLKDIGTSSNRIWFHTRNFDAPPHAWRHDAQPLRRPCRPSSCNVVGGSCRQWSRHQTHPAPEHPVYSTFPWSARDTASVSSRPRRRPPHERRAPDRSEEAAAGQDAAFELGAGTGVATPGTVLAAVHRTSLPSATGPRIERTGHCRGVVRRSRGPRGPPALSDCGHCAARAWQHTTAAAVIKGGRSGRHGVAARRPTSI